MPNVKLSQNSNLSEEEIKLIEKNIRELVKTWRKENKS